ncbi:hypothetical protein DIPPA_00095 [Diplonema papillatum]|nr:hypothetical protein DIPPA_00095 [Diplonema papillatum]
MEHLRKPLPGLFGSPKIRMAKIKSMKLDHVDVTSNDAVREHLEDFSESVVHFSLLAIEVAEGRREVPRLFILTDKSIYRIPKSSSTSVFLDARTALVTLTQILVLCNQPGGCSMVQFKGLQGSSGERLLFTMRFEDDHREQVLLLLCHLCPALPVLKKTRINGRHYDMPYVDPSITQTKTPATTTQATSLHHHRPPRTLREERQYLLGCDSRARDRAANEKDPPATAGGGGPVPTIGRRSADKAPREPARRGRASGNAAVCAEHGRLRDLLRKASDRRDVAAAPRPLAGDPSGPPYAAGAHAALTGEPPPFWAAEEDAYPAGETFGVPALPPSTLPHHLYAPVSAGARCGGDGAAADGGEAAKENADPASGAHPPAFLSLRARRQLEQEQRMHTLREQTAARALYSLRTNIHKQQLMHDAARCSRGLLKNCAAPVARLGPPDASPRRAKDAEHASVFSPEKGKAGADSVKCIQERIRTVKAKHAEEESKLRAAHRAELEPLRSLVDHGRASQVEACWKPRTPSRRANLSFCASPAPAASSPALRTPTARRRPSTPQGSSRGPKARATFSPGEHASPKRHPSPGQLATPDRLPRQGKASDRLPGSTRDQRQGHNPSESPGVPSNSLKQGKASDGFFESTRDQRQSSSPQQTLSVPSNSLKQGKTLDCLPGSTRDQRQSHNPIESLGVPPNSLKQGKASDRFFESTCDQRQSLSPHESLGVALHSSKHDKTSDRLPGSSDHQQSLSPHESLGVPLYSSRHGKASDRLPGSSRDDKQRRHSPAESPGVASNSSKQGKPSDRLPGSTRDQLSPHESLGVPLLSSKHGKASDRLPGSTRDRQRSHSPPEAPGVPNNSSKHGEAGSTRDRRRSPSPIEPPGVPSDPSKHGKAPDPRPARVHHQDPALESPNLLAPTQHEWRPSSRSPGAEVRAGRTGRGSPKRPELSHRRQVPSGSVAPHQTGAAQPRPVDSGGSGNGAQSLLGTPRSSPPPAAARSESPPGPASRRAGNASREDSPAGADGPRGSRRGNKHKQRSLEPLVRPESSASAGAPPCGFSVRSFSPAPSGDLASNGTVPALRLPTDEELREHERLAGM